MATRRARLSTGAKAAARQRPAASKLAAPRREFRDEVLLEKTGRSRDDWFAVLDAFDCRGKGHTASAAHLVEDHGVAPWWSQAITVEYERAREIRSYGQRADGFAVTVQRALAATPEECWTAFSESSRRAKWMGARHRHSFREGGRWSTAGLAAGTYRRIVPGRLLRFTWGGRGAAPGSVVEVEILARGPDRATVKLTHSRIPSAEEREEVRALWSWALDSLKAYAETGSPIAHGEWLAAR